jgi:hypothetical protein
MNFPSEKDFEENTETTFRQEKSYNGYGTSDLKSWLQKSIRRGKVDDAIWAAVELYTLPKQSIVTNLFNRLRIISMEDIGVANPEAVAYTAKILQSLENDKQKPQLPVNENGVKKIARLAAYLAQSKHLRLASDYKAVFMTPYIRDELKVLFSDIYTKKHDEAYSFESKDAKVLGKKMVTSLKKGQDVAFYYMAKILNLKTLPFKTNRSNKPAYYILDLIGKLTKELNVEFNPHVDILVKWLKGGIINSKVDYNLPLYYAMTIILKRDDLKEDEVLPLKKLNIKNFKVIKKGNLPKIPEYALDKHTLTGVRAKKTSLDFAQEGAFVENEDEDLLNERYREVYLKSKTIKPETTKPKKEKAKMAKKETKVKVVKPKKGKINVPLESDVIDFDIRVQATVADSRACTYFGTEKSTGRKIFVKGPYKDEDASNVSIKAYEIKNILDPKLPSIAIKKIKLKPDLFPDVPWGFRRHTDRNKGYWFIIADNIIPADHIPRKVHHTKVWGDVEVVDWAKIKYPKTPKVLELKGDALENYVIAMLFRYALGIPDEADRNFMLLKNGTIYSVDEEGLNSNTNFANALKLKKCDLIKKFIKGNRKKVDGKICEWFVAFVRNEKDIKKILGEDPAWISERLLKLKDKKTILDIFS